jgi:hypothetical protein
VEAVVAESDHEIIYKIPKMISEPRNPRIMFDDHSVYIVTDKISKLVPVSKSPLDAYRGRGKLKGSES